MFPATKGDLMAADYAYKFGRVTISGTCFGAQEHWSTGFQLGQEGASPASVEPGGAEVIATAWQTFFTASGNQFAAGYKTVSVKVALINENGTTDEENIDYFDYPAPISGAQAGTPYPPQITLAATLSSDYQRGLAAKGRMYLPGMVSTIDGTTGKLGATFVNTLVTNFKTFLDNVNAGQTGGAYVIIASKGHKTTDLDTNGQPVYLDGRNGRVTGCRIGDVYDTQRRRRNEFVETYQTRVLV